MILKKVNVIMKSKFMLKNAFQLERLNILFHEKKLL
jgi:hypothetical protein